MIVGVSNREVFELSYLRLDQSLTPSTMEAVIPFYRDLGLFLLAGRATTIVREKTKEGAWLADIVLDDGKMGRSKNTIRVHVIETDSIV